MITTLEIATVLFVRVNTSTLKAAITGGVYKDARPANSTKEDVVVNVITSDSETLQRVVGNVNIHIPNLSNGMPNHSRFTALTELALLILKEGFGATYTYWTESHSLIRDDSNGHWYYNFRIRFNQHNN